MKQSSACVCVLALSVACSANSGPSDSHNTTGGSAGSGGTHASTGGSGGGTATGGTGTVAGTGGVATGGATNGGTGGSSAGAAGASGMSGGGGTGGATATGFKCGPGPFAAPMLSGKTATRIAGAPPSDDFNKNNFGNVEGPVWIGDSLYFSEMQNGSIPLARILKLAPGGVVTVAVTSSGSNGLATDGTSIFAAVHKDGSISQITLPSGPETPIVSMYMSNRFISPNDLAIRSDGTIYFSDPNFQNSTNPAPQSAQRLYRVTPPPARTVSVISDAPNQPNGVTLSPDEKTLYVSGSGLKQFPVMTDGSLGAGTDFPGGGGGDGMVVDCGGNLYVAGNGNVIRVFAPAGGTPIGTIALDASAGTPTNVAFGGTDHQTLYVTAQGNDGQRGVFSVALNVPGFPY